CAIVHYGLLGDLLPQTLSRFARFRRMLGNRAVDPERLRTVLSTALPHSLVVEADALATLVVETLSSSSKRSEGELMTELNGLCERLSPLRLAVRWEAEGESSLGARILEESLAFSEESQAESDALARLREKFSDGTGATGSSRHRPSAPDSDGA